MIGIYYFQEDMSKVRKINVNLWDDYCQKPEHLFNSPTSIRIESLKDLSDCEIELMRGIIFDRCLNWRKLKGARQITFSKNIQHNWKIDITELDEYSRRDLFSYLKKDDTAFKGVRINWLMES